MHDDTFDAAPDIGMVIPLRTTDAPPAGDTERMLSDDDLFAPPEVVTRKVVIPPAAQGGLGAGGAMIVKAPTSDIVARISNETTSFRDGRVESVGDTNALYTLYCVVRPDGSPRFHGGVKGEDYRRIRKMPSLVTARIGKAARELGGVTNSDDEERERFD